MFNFLIKLSGKSAISNAQRWLDRLQSGNFSDGDVTRIVRMAKKLVLEFENEVKHLSPDHQKNKFARKGMQLINDGKNLQAKSKAISPNHDSLKLAVFINALVHTTAGVWLNAAASPDDTDGLEPFYRRLDALADDAPVESDILGRSYAGILVSKSEWLNKIDDMIVEGMIEVAKPRNSALDKHPSSAGSAVGQTKATRSGAAHLETNSDELSSRKISALRIALLYIRNRVPERSNESLLRECAFGSAAAQAIFPVLQKEGKLSDKLRGQIMHSDSEIRRKTGPLGDHELLEFWGAYRDDHFKEINKRCESGTMNRNRSENELSELVKQIDKGIKDDEYAWQTIWTESFPR